MGKEHHEDKQEMEDMHQEIAAVRNMPMIEKDGELLVRQSSAGTCIVASSISWPPSCYPLLVKNHSFLLHALTVGYSNLAM